MKAIAFFILATLNLYGALQTSMLDEPSYRQCCTEIAENAAVFNDFRRLPVICGNIETVSAEFGKQYLEYILQHYPTLVSYFEEFKKNDEVGNPKRVEYESFGLFAPTTLRYAKTAGDLIALFGNMDGWKVLEIGGGYGGQCRILSGLFSITHYSIVDLKEALHLAKAYLDAYQTPNIEYIRPDALPTNQSYDLVISNYALSECIRSVQTLYLEKLVKPSKRGYFLWNFAHHDRNSRSYSLEEIQETLKSYGFKVKISSEEPLTTPEGNKTNFLITWTKP